MFCFLKFNRDGFIKTTKLSTQLIKTKAFLLISNNTHIQITPVI
jgi:hypothetical protein